MTYLQRYKNTFDQEMIKKQQELDNIENTKKQEHNKSMRPKKNNIHTVTSDNDGIVHTRRRPHRTSGVCGTKGRAPPGGVTSILALF